jgi:hypothetical protein
MLRKADIWAERLRRFLTNTKDWQKYDINYSRKRHNRIPKLLF